MIVDVHQHLWPAPLVAALRERTAPPRLRGWTLQLAAEPDYAVDPAQHDPGRRAAQAHADGLDLAVVSLSSPLGIELLAPAEGAPLLDAYHEGALALPRPFRAWAAAGLRDVDPEALSHRLNDGFVGLQLPATTVVDEPGYARVAPLLDELARRGRPLFVHPGPARSAAGAGAAGAGPGPAGAGAAGAGPGRTPDGPAWWPAIVDYVQQMHAAWYAFRAFGRPRHPRLRVCFAMLAGLGPLHGERFAARAGERTKVDEDVFLEISSYGTRAIDAIVRVLGIDVLVNGSDRPYAEPVSPDLGDAALEALRSANPIRLFDSEEVSHGPRVPARAQP